MKKFRTFYMSDLCFVLLFTSLSGTLFSQQFEPSLTKSTITAGPVKYGVDIPYNLTITNNGTDTITNVVLRDFVGEGYTFDPISNPGWATDPMYADAVLFTFTGLIPPLESEIVTLNLNINAADDAMDWDNTAEIVSFTDTGGTDRTGEDANAGNNSDNSVAPVFDLALTKRLITSGDINYGDTLTFRTVVTNQGNIGTGNVTITDYIPEGYDNPTDLNTAIGWTSVAVNPMYTFSGIPVGESDSVDILLILSMDMANGDAWDNYTEITLTFDDTDQIVFIDADSTPNSNTPEERSVKPGDADDNYIGNSPENAGFQDDHDPAGPEIYDLAIIKERLTGPPSYSYGQGITYSIDIHNQGNDTIMDIIYKDTLPCGIEDLDLGNNPGWTYDPTSRVATKVIAGPLAPSAVDRDTINLTVRPCYDDPYSAWTNVVEIFEARDTDGNIVSDIDSDADDNFTNDAGGVPGSPTDNDLDGDGTLDEDDHDVEAIEIVDMAIRKTVTTPGPYEDGQLIEFNIRVFNQGNVEATETFIEEFIPVGFTYEQSVNGPLGWDQPVNVGPLSIDRLAHTNLTPLAAGDSTDITLRLRLNLDGQTPEDWYNYAHVLITRDSLTNNRFDDADSNPFTETPEERSVIPGDVNDDNIFTLGENVGEDQDDHDPATISFFDLSLSKTAPVGNFGYGDDVTFTIALANEGNRRARGVTITDHLPCGYQLAGGNNGWTSVGNTVTYTHVDTLYPGEVFNIPITLTLQECTNGPLSWTNVAEISDANDVNGDPIDDQDSTPDADPNNNDDGEDDIDDATIDIFDLSLSKAFSVEPTSTAVGSPLSYNITVTNEGNVPAANIEIEDMLPCGLDFVSSAGWTSNGSSITYTILGPIASGASVIVPLTLNIGTCTTGQTPNYTNIAEISDVTDENGGPVDDIDSTPGNGDPNEDDIDVQPFDVFDLNLTKTLISSGPYEYGQSLTYEIVVENEGTVPAISYTVSEYLQCGLSFNPAINPGWAVGASGNPEITINTPLPAGSSNTITVQLTLESCDDPAQTNAWTNIAEITDAEDPNGPADDQDSTPDNNDPDEDDQDEVPFDVFDLSLEKTVTSTAAEYEAGDEVTYQITISNEGNIVADEYTVTDMLPCNLQLSAASTGWTTNGSGSVSYTSTTSLQPGATQSVELIATVVECPAGNSEAVNIAEITEAVGPDGSVVDDIDSTPDNNDPTEDDQDDAVVTIISGALIGDFVFDDLDGDGIQDFNEPGIPGVVVTVYDDNQNEVTSLVTDANGGYEVELPVGDYYIVFDPMGDYEPTITGAGSDSNDSNITNDFGTGSTSLFTVENGVDNFTIDGGFFQCVEIEGIAWYDVNEDDTRQDYENGINGLPINLYRQVGGAWVLWETQTTHHDWDTPSDDGLWDFCVSPGTYYIQVEQPPQGLVRVRPFVGGSFYDSDINNANGTNTTSSFTLVSGQSKTDLGAGYYPMATVGNSVWYDENGNGLQDNSEARIADVVVEAYDENHDLIKSTTTDSEGVYKLDYLEKQTYYLKFVAPEGYSFTGHVSGNDDMNSDVTHYNGLNTTNSITLSPGMDIINIDAGLQQGVLPVTWLSFDAEAMDKYNRLEWTTIEEENNSHFIVEKLFDGPTRNFEAIGEVRSNDQIGVSTYTFEDHDIQSGVTYYRLKQVDVDGSHDYSNLISLERTKDHSIHLYPNPTRGNIQLSGEWSVDQNIQVSVISNTGQLLKQFDYNNPPATLSIDLSDIPKGIHQIEVNDNAGNVYIEKLIRL